MHIKSIELDPFDRIEFLNAGRRKNDPFIDYLPVHLARTDQLPDSLDAIMISADLQGREVSSPAPNQPLRLIGEVLPDRMDDVFQRLGFNAVSRIGSILAGDLYTVPGCTERGGTGDATEVWNAFAIYRWLVGVAGNHDTFGDASHPSKRQDQHFLSADRCELDGIRFAGLGGVIGNPRKNQRRTHDDYMENLELLLSKKTDIMVMHEGPRGDGGKYSGYVGVREVIESCPKTLVIRGHKHWPEPLIELKNGTQVLNVEATIVVLMR